MMIDLNCLLGMPMPMPGRTLSGAEGYRYAFQGQ